MSERVTGEIKERRMKLNSSDKEPIRPLPPLPPDTVRFVDVQIYDVPAEDVLEAIFLVESTLEPDEGETAGPSMFGENQWELEQEPSLQDENQRDQTQETQQPPENVSLIRTRMCLHPFPLVLAVLCLLFAGVVSVVGVVHVLPLLAPSATVTIIPDSRQITTTSPLQVVTGATNAELHQLQGRMLSSLTMSQTQTVPTTGRGHQDARVAYGRITFYNAAPYAQTVTAGTLLTGRDSVQVVTDQDAVLPAVAYPTLGQATVSAHAVIPGPAGNIRGGEIYGPCCRLNVSAVNTAFSGGQDARYFQMVTERDIIGVATSLTTNLERSVQAALQTQVQRDETLVTPVPCKQTVTSDHAAGDQTAQVQITVDETCTGEVYNTPAYRDLIRQIVSQQARKQLGGSYALSGAIQATINTVTMNVHGLVDLEVTSTGIWGYQFSLEQLQQLKRMYSREERGPGQRNSAACSRRAERLDHAQERNDHPNRYQHYSPELCDPHLEGADPGSSKASLSPTRRMAGNRCPL